MKINAFSLGLLAVIAVLVVGACSALPPVPVSYGPGNMMGGSGMMSGNGMMGGYSSSRSVPAAPPTPIGATAEPVDREIQITASNLRFVPTQVTVKPGEKVRFVITNTDGVLHNFGSDDARIAYVPLPAGTTQSVVWTAPAKVSTYTALCTLHAGMSLSIVIRN
jgi:plastocyanin